MDLVSVVITTYKREPDIVDRAIKSVVNQTYSNIEIIVVDDSPCDYCFRNDIRAIVNKYMDCCKINYYSHEKNLGACAARNTGLRYANGSLICFLDDDDEYLESKIEKQIQVLAQDTTIAMVYCNCIVIDDESGNITIQNKKMYRGNVYEHIISENFIGSTSFPLLKKDCLIAVGGFDVNLPACQDYDMWLRICKKYSIDYINEPLVLYHNHSGEQITKNKEKRIYALQQLIHKNETILNSNNRLWSIFHVKLITEYIHANKTKEAVELLWTCFFKYPWLIKQYLQLMARIIKVKLI